MSVQCASSGVANSRAIPMLLSTTIKEEEEEDLAERPSPVSAQPAAALLPAGQPGPVSHGESKARNKTVTACQASHTAASALAGASALASKVWSRLLPGGRRRHGDGEQRCSDGAGPTAPFTEPVEPVAAVADGTPAAPLRAVSQTQPRPRITCSHTHAATTVHPPPLCSARVERRIPDPVGVPPSARQQEQRQQPQPQTRSAQSPTPLLPKEQQQQQSRQQQQPSKHAQQPLSRQQHPHHRDHSHHHQHHQQQQQQQQQHQSQHNSGHLVRPMAGDDVRLALQALQLAAQIHDHVWGPAGTTATAGSREALLEAASPLYDTAMSAARAIQHRALHSLVKQAVRRYVNPARGSPDDVLRVILELLTGCGGTAAATAPAVVAARGRGPEEATTCFSDVVVGQRGVSLNGGGAAGAGAAFGRRRRGGTDANSEPATLERSGGSSSTGDGSSCGSTGGGSSTVDRGARSSEFGGGSGSCGGGSEQSSNASSLSGWDASNKPSSNSGGGGGGGGSGWLRLRLLGKQGA